MTAFLRMIWTVITSAFTILGNLLEAAEWSVRWAVRIIFIYLAAITVFAALGAYNSVLATTIALVITAIWLLTGWGISIIPFIRREEYPRIQAAWRNASSLSRSFIVAGILIGLIGLIALCTYATLFASAVLLLVILVGYTGFTVPNVPILWVIIGNSFSASKKILQGLAYLLVFCIGTGFFFAYVHLKLGWEGRVALVLVAITYLLLLYAAGSESKIVFVTGWILIIMVVGGVIGWPWIKATTYRVVAVARLSILSHDMPSLHLISPEVAGTETLNSVGKDGKITVQPDTPSAWIERPDNSYRFAWDVERTVAPYLDTERVYIDGTSRVVNCLIEEEKPIAKVRFIHRGKSIPIKVKIWYSRNPDI